ncbi:MAG: radical SAM family heme chaperone HemW [Chlamydiota bacterium]|jgi:oxygen-independent coproporphyrinogen-3 oxidase
MKKKKIPSPIKTDGKEESSKTLTPTTGKISLYFHIPFCRKKCPYCHFFVIRDEQDKQVALTKAFLQEIDLNSHLLAQKEIVSIYFGGGTPILLSPKYFAKVLNKISANFTLSLDCEITMEANPEDIDQNLIMELKEVGFNRFSVGVQTLNDTLLKKIGRNHSSAQIKKALYCLHDCLIDNVSIDLMYDLPDQTLSAFQDTLMQVEALPISHLSLYNLTIEPNTVLFRKQKTLNLPSSETSYQMLEYSIEKLESMGLMRYEISAFAKNGKVSKHNLGYWTSRDFLGFGPSAYSYFDKKRYRNIANFPKYISQVFANESPIDFEEKLPYTKQVKEALVIGLRVLQGINLPSFANFWKISSKEVFSYTQGLIEQQFLKYETPFLSLTEKGKLFYDTVASEIV